MFVYEKKLQYPVRIANPNPKLAAFIISQYGGPDGELGASLRYLSQRYTMPYPELKALLTDIGVEELGHLEMVGAIVHQLTRSMTEQEVKDAGYEAYFVDHTAGVYPTAASGFPWNAASMAVKGDLIADLTEDLAAEQKARVTYDNILRLTSTMSSSSCGPVRSSISSASARGCGWQRRRWIRRISTSSTPPSISRRTAKNVRPYGRTFFMAVIILPEFSSAWRSGGGSPPWADPAHLESGAGRTR